MNAKLKQNSAAEPEKKRKGGRSFAKSNRSAQLSEKNSSSDWSESIESLKGQGFETISEAIDGIINEAGNKYGGAVDPETREVLALLFETDPLLSATIERLLVKTKKAE
jgi:hypothetical protein